MKDKNNIKLGFLVGHLSYGGGERILKMLITYFKEKNYNITIFTWNNEWLQFEQQYEIVLLNDYPIGGLGKYNSFKELKKVFSRSNIDTLIVFSIGFAEVALWSAKAVKIPIILSERVDPNFSPKSKLRRLYKKILFKYADGVVFQTSEVQNYYKRFLRNNSIVIHNPIIDNYLPEIKKIKRKEIVVVSRLSPEKRIGAIIECFSLIDSKDYKLIIYGEGPERERLHCLISKFKLTGRVVLKGKIHDVLESINGADIFIMNSEMEGMPNALIEAMAMGLSCISTNFPSGGARALIDNYVNGVLIELNDKENLKEALNLLINDREFSDKLKLNAVNIRNTHCKDVIMPKWESFIYDKVLKNENNIL